MPKCKNNPKRTYKGTEPSPKGLGYCGSGEKVGTRRIGKDGMLWIVSKTKTGSKRWTRDPLDDCGKVVIYKKKIKKTLGYVLRTLVGLEYVPGYVHKRLDYNTFEKKPTKVGKGFRKGKVNKDWLKRYICDASKNKLTRNNPMFKKIKHQGAKTYMAHDNGGRPFLVYITKKGVFVYKKPGDKYWIESDDYRKKWTFVEPVAKHPKVVKVFVGKSPKTPMTEFSGGIGPRFDGNSILVNLKGNTYLYIGNSVYQFQTQPGDAIVEYISPVGNNDVPYPVAIGTKNVYFMLDQEYVPITKFPKFDKAVKNSAYSYYYGHADKTLKPLAKLAKKMKGLKLVQKRLW